MFNETRNNSEYSAFSDNQLLQKYKDLQNSQSGQIAYREHVSKFGLPSEVDDRQNQIEHDWTEFNALQAELKARGLTPPTMEDRAAELPEDHI